MTTPEWVFSRAIHLMDEQNETNGQTTTADTQEYKTRTLSILNILCGELYPYSDTFPEGESGKRPVCQELLDFDDEIGLDDVLCRSILPYGLAAHLLLGENDSMASFFSDRYEELLATLAKQKPSVWEELAPYYGI